MYNAKQIYRRQTTDNGRKTYTHAHTHTHTHTHTHRHTHTHTHTHTQRRQTERNTNTNKHTNLTTNDIHGDTFVRHIPTDHRSNGKT